MAQHKCPHCGTMNTDSESTKKSIEAAFIPPLLFAAIRTEVDSKDKRFGLIMGIVVATSIVTYINGKKITCGNCGEHFRD